MSIHCVSSWTARSIKKKRNVQYWYPLYVLSKRMCICLSRYPKFRSPYVFPFIIIINCYLYWSKEMRESDWAIPLKRNRKLNKKKAAVTFKTCDTSGWIQSFSFSFLIIRYWHSIDHIHFICLFDNGNQARLISNIVDTCYTFDSE